MTTIQIADRLAQLCRAGDFVTAQEELYAENVVSIEPVDAPEYPKVTTGHKAVLAKIKNFMESVEKMHAMSVSEPLIAGNSIAFTMEMDMTSRGQRNLWREICVYETKNGKIVSEQFFM